MAQRTISKWRYIDQQKLTKRIKTIPLGGEPIQYAPVRGLGQTNRDTDWRQRVAWATAPQPKLSQEQAEEALNDLVQQTDNAVQQTNDLINETNV